MCCCAGARLIICANVKGAALRQLPKYIWSAPKKPYISFVVCSAAPQPLLRSSYSPCQSPPLRQGVRALPHSAAVTPLGLSSGFSYILCQFSASANSSTAAGIRAKNDHTLSSLISLTGLSFNSSILILFTPLSFRMVDFRSTLRSNNNHSCKILLWSSHETNKNFILIVMLCCVKTA